jgi:hypothetical protein
MCQQQQPTQQQLATTELPEWAKPYAKDILAKGQALTDVNQNPYQQYTQPRIAGFSPMQQQAMQAAQGMQVAPQIGQATGAASLAGLGGLGIASQANPQNFQQNVGGYMNTNLGLTLAPQLEELRRQYGITGTQQAGQATQAGAFGGSRDAIMAAENQRNLGAQQNQAIGQAYNQAFQNAQNQYNQSQNQALQGYGLTGQMAGQLGQLGQNQYGQQMGINQLQAQYGGQQQALEQQGLTQSYQDFLNQQNYPYKQIGFMSDLIRGLPLGQQSTSQIYQSPGSISGQIAGLGMGAYGLSQLGFGKAEGGEIHEYAGGGEIESAGNIAGILSKLSDEQLQKAKQAAVARRDVEEANLIDQEMAHRASMRTGVASVPVDSEAMASDENPDSITGYATGGSAVQELVSKPKEAEPSLEEQTMGILDKLSARSKPAMDSLNAQVESVKARPEEIKQRGLGEALAQYGFGWAAKAAEPGARFFGSAAKASPILAESAINTQKAIQAAQDNYSNLKMNQTKYQIALDKGDMQTAATMAGQLRQDKRDQRNYELTAAKEIDDFKYKQEVLANQRAQIAASAGSHVAPFMQAYNELKSDPANKDKSREELMSMASRAVYGAQYGRNEGMLAQKIQEDIAKDAQIKNFGYQMMGAKTDAERAAIQEKIKRREIEIEGDVMRRANPQGGSASGSISSALPQGGSMRDKGFKNLGTE